MLKLAYQIGFELALQEELSKVAVPLLPRGKPPVPTGLWEKLKGALGFGAAPKPGSWEAFQAKAVPGGDATTTKAFQNYAGKVRQGGAKSIGNVQPKRGY